jgi:hypothetical protein
MAHIFSQPKFRKKTYSQSKLVLRAACFARLSAL